MAADNNNNNSVKENGQYGRIVLVVLESITSATSIIVWMEPAYTNNIYMCVGFEIFCLFSIVSLRVDSVKRELKATTDAPMPTACASNFVFLAQATSIRIKSTESSLSFTHSFTHSFIYWLPLKKKVDAIKATFVQYVIRVWLPVRYEPSNKAGNVQFVRSSRFKPFS